MKMWHVVVIVLLGMATVAAAFLLIAALWFIGLPNEPHEPVGTILVYEVVDDDPPAVGPAGMQMIIRAVDARLNAARRTAQVRTLGRHRIEVGVFGTDPTRLARVERLLGSVGTLEFRILANTRDHRAAIDRATASQERRVRDGDGNLLARWVPVEASAKSDFESPGIVRRTGSLDGQETMEVLVVNDRFNVTGAYLESARRSVDARGTSGVEITFSRPGGRLFGGLTGNNLPDETHAFYRQLGIILNGQLHSAPRIHSTISNRGVIEGGFTREEVEDLASTLNSGPLPAAIRLIERRTVDRVE